ncbi:hypothetical protein [Paenibacillus tuaregi]|uniref:hypothetical protein n=1 Tax=Paenibacillus tuaregi TaxID=1816681 RepID=UPI000B1CFE76|nr:hypothetical protein [Paenibacillus tuaregi]
MEQMNNVTPQSGWTCSISCAGPCFVACAAGVETGPAALAIVTGSFLYNSYAN